MAGGAAFIRGIGTRLGRIGASFSKSRLRSATTRLGSRVMSLGTKEGRQLAWRGAKSMTFTGARTAGHWIRANKWPAAAIGAGGVFTGYQLGKPSERAPQSAYYMQQLQSLRGDPRMAMAFNQRSAMYPNQWSQFQQPGYGGMPQGYDPRMMAFDPNQMRAIQAKLAMMMQQDQILTARVNSLGGAGTF